VQHSSEPLVAVESCIPQGLIETGNGSLVHLLMRPIAAVSADDGRLITVLVRVCGWATEGLGPVRGQPFGVLGMVSVTERMANHFVLQHPRVPGMGQPKKGVEASRGLIDGLRGFSFHYKISRRLTLICADLRVSAAERLS